MKAVDLGTGTYLDRGIPETLPAAGVYIACRTSEVHGVRERFGWDESVETDLVNANETVRHSGYNGYDFISLIHLDVRGKTVGRHVLHLLIGKQAFVSILPEPAGARLIELENELRRFAEASRDKPDKIEALYRMVFNRLASDVSATLEKLEDDLESLSEAVTEDPRKSHLSEIGRLRKTVYAFKKNLRATASVCDGILMNENSLLHEEQLQSFRGESARLKKLYDFTESLYELSGEILNIYDSNLSVRMNESVSKLTAIMLFLALVTMITGIFSMDLKFMPSIDSIVGYPLALLVIAVISYVIYRVLKRKKWL